MFRAVRPATVAVAATMIFAALLGCRERESLGGSLPAFVPAGELAAACAGDSLRPAVAAPAQGLWLYERPSSRERVAAMIGPARSDNRALTVTRPVESVEVTLAGDTLRSRLDAASVSLELLPPPSAASFGDGGVADSVASSPHPVATYALSSRVRLAAYEPCATSARGPRVRYLRRDGTGRIVTDVMLSRASEK